MKLVLFSKQIIAYFFVVLAVAIVAGSLWFSHKLVKELAGEERNKIEIWAEATKQMADENENSDMSLILHILQSNTTIPVILYDVASNQYVSNNINVPLRESDAFLKKKTEEFAKKHNPIVLDELNQFLYYDDSYTLKQLSVYPYIQLSVMFVFIALAFFALRSSLKAEQNRVGMGLSKETAHQLGTPISSLLAWVELMRLKNVDAYLLDEVGKDLGRLELIVERFSKIGSKPDLKSVDLRLLIEKVVLYMERRISAKVNVRMVFPHAEVLADVNEPLFEWGIENLIKNATDAMAGMGDISFDVFEKGSRVIIDISDTGKGIEKSKFKTIFTPGYTTKARGWGLGLSLVKRIIDTYHKGKIYVKSSEIGEGTTFRIVINKSDRGLPE